MKSYRITFLTLLMVVISLQARDLVSPAMTHGEPAPGKRVRQVAPEYKGTDVYHSLYLPLNWKPGGRYPVIVEYTGNRFPPGKGSGEVKDANLGFGLTGGRGFIWVTMPYVAKGRQKNAVQWWGDRQATIDYCKLNLPRICKQYGGDLDNLFVCGFSRGAIGASYIGLADDEIASFWKGMVTHDHFDGQKTWGYAGDDRAAALKRLARLKGRPVLVCGNGNDYLKDYLGLAKFTFLKVPVATIFSIPEGRVIHPHTDLWMHRASPYRQQARAWLQRIVRTPVLKRAPTVKPLKVYLLVGQSNMQGHAAERTLKHLGMDPQTAPLLKAIQNADGTAKVHDRIWISSIDTSEESGVKQGKLTVGYGAGGRGSKIGPELTFGITMQQHVGEPILIIKTSWGGKSLNTDFRPPSADAYRFNENQIENFKKRGKDVAAERKAQAERTGVYYRLMLEHIRKVLGDIKTVYPKYDAKAGYELAGFVWFQGWNDMVDGSTYPTRGQPGSYDAYSKNLAHFIRDVRKDLKAPKLPFVIGVMGAGGPIAKYGPDQKRYAGIHGEFRKAMAAPSKLPEFKGNVTAVFTENYWDGQLSELVDRRGKINAKRRELSKDQSLTRTQRDKAIAEFSAKLFTQEELKILEVGVSNAAYHYLGSAKILGQIGKAFADALAEME